MSDQHVLGVNRIEEWARGRTTRLGLRFLALSPVAMFTSLSIVPEYRWIPAATGFVLLCVGLGMTTFGIHVTPEPELVDEGSVDE